MLDYDQPSARERLERLAGAAARSAEPPRTAVPILERVRRTQELLRFPSTLRAAGISAERIVAPRASIVTSTLRSPAALANPRVPSAKDVESLLDAVIGS